jgi:hypothetical protein
MPGFARRYFTLYQSGILSYSLGHKQPARDQVDLLEAAITTATSRKDIHIDSATALFHLKCLTSDDFSVWMSALRSIPFSSAQSSMLLRLSKCRRFTASTIRKSSHLRVSPKLNHLSKSGVIIEDMGTVRIKLLSLRGINSIFRPLFNWKMLSMHGKWTPS